MEGKKARPHHEEGGEASNGKALLGLKLRRGIASAKRGGACTPVPAWKLEEDPSTAVAAPPDPPVAPRRSSVSARQLGASLWEIQDLLPLHPVSRRKDRHRQEGNDGRDEEPGRPPPPLIPTDRPQSSGSLRRHVAASLIQHHKVKEMNGRDLHRTSPASYSSSIGIATINEVVTPSSSYDARGHPGEACYSLKTSTELLKVLNRIWSLEEQHTANVSLVKSLKAELQHARARIHELMQERQGYRREVDALVKQVSEDKLIRKNKEQEKIKAAVQSIRDELEDERRLRRRSENIHRKLGKELSELKAAFLKAARDLEREREANHLLEDLCDEFAKGIINYEEEIRGLKQKTGKDYDHKFDRVVLHISEAWLDERMQIQIAEARGDFAEKHAITERLSGEIQTFLQARQSCSSKNNDVTKLVGKRDGNIRRQSLESVHLNGATSAPQVAEDDDSVASDLACFELNMHEDDPNHHDQLKRPCKSLSCGGKKLEFTEKTAGESSSSLKTQFGARKGGAKVAGVEVDQLGAVMSHQSETTHDHHHGGYPGGEYQTHDSRADQFCEGTISGDIYGLMSPVQPSIRRCAPSDMEITECSPELPDGVKENTLKAKLLQARLEGRHARLKASTGASAGRKRK